jgi:hypothetical protein
LNRPEDLFGQERGVLEGAERDEDRPQHRNDEKFQVGYEELDGEDDQQESQGL